MKSPFLQGGYWRVQRHGNQYAMTEETLAPDRLRSCPMIEILIADDHALMRRGFKQILDETSDITVGGVAATSEEVLAQVRSRNWDVMVLDITLADGSGLEVLEEVKRVSPLLPVVVMSMNCPDHYAARLIKAGASGFLPKESAPEELIEAIRKVHAGERYISPSTMRVRPELPRKALHAHLSRKEMKVLLHLAAGRTVAQIARREKLPTTKVEHHREAIMQKMRLQSSSDLTNYAIRNKLLERLPKPRRSKT